MGISGGKIEPGETGEDCAVRECREELGVEIQLQGLREETVYEYPDGLYGFAFYDGVIISGEPEKGFIWRSAGFLRRS